MNIDSIQNGVVIDHIRAGQGMRLYHLLKLDETEHRRDHLMLEADLKTEQLRSGFYGLFAEWRDLDTYVYATIGGEEILIARGEGLPPRSLTFELYLEPGVADLLSGDTVPDVRVDSYYADTGEFFDSIPAEIARIYRSD